MTAKTGPDPTKKGGSTQMIDPRIDMAGCWTARQSVDAPRDSAEPSLLEELADQLLCYSDEQGAEFEVRIFVSEVASRDGQPAICMSFESLLGVAYLLEDARGDYWVVCRRGSCTYLHSIETRDGVGTLFTSCVIALTHIDLSPLGHMCIH